MRRSCRPHFPRYSRLRSITVSFCLSSRSRFERAARSDRNVQLSSDIAHRLLRHQAGGCHSERKDKRPSRHHIAKPRPRYIRSRVMGRLPPSLPRDPSGQATIARPRIACSSVRCFTRVCLQSVVIRQGAVDALRSRCFFQIFVAADFTIRSRPLLQDGDRGRCASTGTAKAAGWRKPAHGHDPRAPEFRARTESRPAHGGPTTTFPSFPARRAPIPHHTRDLPLLPTGRPNGTHAPLVKHQNRQIHAVENVSGETAEDELAQSAMSVSSHDQEISVEAMRSFERSRPRRPGRRNRSRLRGRLDTRDLSPAARRRECQAPGRSRSER